jgi:predicted nucleotide-binding protein
MSEELTIIRKAKKSFYNLQSDLLNSKDHNFGNHLKAFIDFCENDPVLKQVTLELKNKDKTDIKQWWDAFGKSGGSMVGSKRYSLPTDPEQAASLLYKFMSGINNGDFNFLAFTINVYGHRQIDQDVYEFNNDISRKVIRALNQKLDEVEIMSQKTQKESSGINIDKQAVFVVHGRNMEIRTAMFDFLRSLGLKPIEWSQAVAATGKGSPYVGEVLDKAFSMAQAVVVLMTPDDEGRLLPKFQSAHDPTHEKELTPQARLNVIFEAGIAMGRREDRTIIVEIGNLRPFSDVIGRHVVRLDNSGPKRNELAQRLSTAGCQVDRSGQDWLTCGSFALKPDSQKSNGVLMI